MKNLLIVKSNLLPYILLLLVITVSYSNTLNNEFLWDDEFLIQKNKFINNTKYISKIITTNTTAGFGGKDNFYRPTQILFYLAINKVFGKSKIVYHLGNILLHIMNSFLLFLLIVSLVKCQEIALISCLLWAVHPIHTEAITYMSATADPMGTFFILLSLVFFTKKKLVISLVCFILALMSKEATVVLPGLIFIVHFMNLDKDKRLNVKEYKFLIWYAFITIIYLCLRKTILNFDETFSVYKVSNIYTENISYRIFTYLASFTEYMKILMMPIQLHMERDFSVYTSFLSFSVASGALLVLILLIASLYLYKKNIDVFLFSLLWFFISFIPMMGILIPVNSFILEHWLYLPSMTFFLVIALILMKLDRAWMRYSLLVMILLPSSFLTYQRNKDWKDPITFYSNILKYSKGSARVHNNLAMAFSDNDEWPKAITHYQKAITLQDTYPQTHYNLARLYLRRDKIQLALEHLKRSLEIDESFKHASDLIIKIQEYRNKK
jgi:tetratricopeptide (TPR) repeat protein